MTKVAKSIQREQWGNTRSMGGEYRKYERRKDNIGSMKVQGESRLIQGVK